MSHYAVEIDLSNANSSHSQVIDLAGGAARVLDVGCWTGEIGAILRQQGAHVSGFEIDQEAAQIAAERLDRVETGDLDRTPLSEVFADERFDAVIFADVLEHVYDPVGVLRDAATLLTPGGRVVISIPNVTHGALRLALAQGRWRTTETGLLDHTHIRFFSRDGLHDLLRSAGLVAVDLRGTTAEPLHTEVQIDADDLPEGFAAWVREQPDALIYQFQVAAQIPRPEDDPDSPPPLVPAEDPGLIRESSREREAQRWRQQLIARDHVLGLEGALATANRRQQRDAETIATLTAQTDRLTKRLQRTTPATPPPPRSGARRLAGRIKRRLTR